MGGPGGLGGFGRFGEVLGGFCEVRMGLGAASGRMVSGGVAEPVQ